MVIYIIASFGVSAVIIPLVILLCKKRGWYDSTNGRKVHSGSVPRLGSFGFVPVFLVLSSMYAAELPGKSWAEYLPLSGAGLIVFLMGVVDDFYELSAKIKLLIQCIAGAIPILFKFSISRIGPIEPGFLGPILTFIWIIGVINAFNLIDGVDALCGSLSLCILVTLGTALLIAGSEYWVLPFMLGAGILGFLLYNKPKAKIFMGDGGSQFLGFSIAVLPLCPFPAGSGIEYNMFALVIVIASMPILDTFAAIWRRSRERRSFFTPDKLHLHHKLINMGYTTKSILGFLLIIQAGMCGVSLLAAVWIKGNKGFAILCGAFGAMLVFFTIIHYTNHAFLRGKEKNGNIGDSE
ncbi:MAG: undecaprenyl/decaprenyl-phosphate alpha-N-acetylglucosaminyl 1-phosphate transferase [Spirochaetaceae bacterium]|nr:undecaprenyl/decaprenyl-phosphate alpha-N-acetylglucosaminyl 1-phosphate transferase [Spirochaetaceae bacterium]